MFFVRNLETIKYKMSNLAKKFRSGRKIIQFLWQDVFQSLERLNPM